MVDDTGLEPVTSRTSTPVFCFSNIFCLFMIVFAPDRLLSNTFERQVFRLFLPCLWLVVWSASTLPERWQYRRPAVGRRCDISRLYLDNRSVNGCLTMSWLILVQCITKKRHCLKCLRPNREGVWAEIGEDEKETGATLGQEKGVLGTESLPPEKYFRGETVCLSMAVV